MANQHQGIISGLQLGGRYRRIIFGQQPGCFAHTFGRRQVLRQNFCRLPRP
jgi:hypothetical protein